MHDDCRLGAIGIDSRAETGLSRFTRLSQPVFKIAWTKPATSLDNHDTDALNCNQTHVTYDMMRLTL